MSGFILEESDVMAHHRVLGYSVHPEHRQIEKVAVEMREHVSK